MSRKEQSKSEKEQLVPITFRLEASVLKHLKKLSHEMSLKEGDDVSYVDLIRRAINKHYPIE